MKNIIQSFAESVEKFGDNPCVHFEQREKWNTISWNKFSEFVANAAAGLRRHGIKPGDRVAVFGPTTWKWTLADMALLTAGAIVVPIYQTLPSSAVKKILDDADIETVVGDAALWNNMNHPKMDFISYEFEGEKCLGNFIKETQLEANAIFEEAKNYDLNKIATIVYTSGTTGDPKGVIITHKNIAAETKAVRNVFLFPPHYVGIAFLPLSHVLGRMMQFYQLAHGCQTAYVPDLRRLPQAYRTIRPHYLCTVPRLLEKIQEGIHAELSRKPAFVKRIFEWATKIGDKLVDYNNWHKPAPLWLRAKYSAADLLIFKKVRAALGGRVRAIVCGGAPLSKSLARLLHYSGMSVLEGYGLTETFAAVTVNRLDDFRIGTVGKPVRDVEIKFSADGELLIRGPVVFSGYWQKESETRKAFTEDGWFKSGDLGEFTRDGFVRLTGRKKDIIITAGGKNIEPVPIEDKLKLIPFITQAVLYGDGKKFLSAIIAVDPIAMRDEATKRNMLLSENIDECPYAHKMVEEQIDKINSELASFERIRKFIIVPRPLSIEKGELTPTLKVRRNIVADKHSDRLDRLYKC